MGVDHLKLITAQCINPHLANTKPHHLQPPSQTTLRQHPKAATSNSGTLPQDIVTDILSRLPVKSLCRFKCVSPSWNSLISHPHFAKTHLHRTKTQNPKNLDRKIIITTDIVYSVDFTDVNPTATKLDLPMIEEQVTGKRVQVLCSCDGLLLVSLKWMGIFYLFNPSTRECKDLPVVPFLLNPIYVFHSSIYGVGYDSSTDDYKVLMLNTHYAEPDDIRQRELTMGAVYSLKTNAWERIQDFDYLLSQLSGGVFFNGCIHGICEKPGSKSRIIVAFDLSDEVFREVPHPASFNKFEMAINHLAILGGCLCLVNMGNMLWMMKEYGVRESWTKFTIPSGLHFANLSCKLAEDEFLVKTCPWTIRKLVVYNLQKDTSRDMVVCGIPHTFSFEGTYIESLVSPGITELVL